MPAITPNLWFDTNGEEAVDHYVSIFPNSSVGAVTRYAEAGPGEAGAVMTIDFTLDGTKFTVINGGPQFTFDEAVSFLIDCADQAEVDYYWDKLGAGGSYGPCGWLKDKFGLSWQVVPKGFEQMMTSSDTAAAQRAVAAMMEMSKLDLAKLQSAYDGTA